MSDAIVRVRPSTNGGHTWKDYRVRSLGEEGEYGKRVRWGRFGQARQFVVEIEVTGDVSADLIAASVLIEGVQ